MIMIITIRPPTAPPTIGPMTLDDTNADSDCLVTGNAEVEIVVLCVGMPMTGSVVLSVVDVGESVAGRSGDSIVVPEVVGIVNLVIGESVAALVDIGEPVIGGMTV